MSCPEYKIMCINLERRQDRRKKMEQIFEEQNITNYHFFEAFDGHNLDLSNTQLNLYKHDYSYFVCRRGALGCSLSHYNIWNNLLLDENCDIYVVLEDDVNLCPDFKHHLENFIKQINNNMYFVYLGMTVTRTNFLPSRKIYENNNDYLIYPLSREYYEGGNFGYIITKNGAENLVNGINNRGIKNTIDDIVNKYCPNLYETHPHIVFTDAVGFVDHFVDSDIQTDQDESGRYHKVNLAEKPLKNDYVFDDYDFYPNLDSLDGDIKQLYCDIPALKRIADGIEDCVAFNTYGWIKYHVVPENEFINLENHYYVPEGIYIKKITTNNKI